MYGYLGKMLFIDLVYELTVNTLGAAGEIPCNASMDRAYDQCVLSEIGDALQVKLATAAIAAASQATASQQNKA